MAHFWTYAREMLRKRATIAWAMVFALISAGGLGVGLLSLYPALTLILRGESLVDMANGYNDKAPAIRVPTADFDA